jgi:hypothetical protein
VQAPVDGNAKSAVLVNGVPRWKAKPYHAKLGETQLWTIRNETQWDQSLKALIRMNIASA